MTNETTASEREARKIEPGSDEHLTLIGAQWHFNLLTVKDREDMLAFGRAVWWAARAALPAPADQVLVPKRLTRAMREVLDEEGWTWEDLLAAAEAITAAEYAELQAAPADQPPSQEGSSGSLFESGIDADRKARQQEAQASQPPQGADYREMWLEQISLNQRLCAALAAPPQGANRKFQIGDAVTKIKGSNWSGRVVGTYSTELTQEGYAVESSTEKGSVQIYPASALAASPQGASVKRSEWESLSPEARKLLHDRTRDYVLRQGQAAAEARDKPLSASPLPAPQEPAMTEAQALVIADKYGQRWKASDEEGISFEKSQFFMFLAALLAAQNYASPAPDSTP